MEKSPELEERNKQKNHQKYDQKAIHLEGCKKNQNHGQNFDLVIFGGSVFGLAAAYFALDQKVVKTQVRKICIVSNKDKNYYKNLLSNRAVPNMIQNVEASHSKYVLESNNVWRSLEKELNQNNILQIEGGLSFGQKDTKLSYGNIVLENFVIDNINENSKCDIKKSYTDNVLNSSPQFMKNFKLKKEDEKNWSSLYEPNGSTINYGLAHQKLQDWLQKNPKITFKYKSFLKGSAENNDEYQFRLKNYSSGSLVSENVSGKKVLMAEDDLWTGYYLKQIIQKNQEDEQEFNHHLYDQLILQNFTYSYYETQLEQSRFLPTFINYLNISTENNPAERDDKIKGIYGFRPHFWDNPFGKQTKSLKITSTVFQELEKKKFKQNADNDKLYQPSVDKNGAKLNKEYAQNYLNIVKGKEENCPLVRTSCEGRQTILDYLNRTNKNFVVQTSGQFEKFAPIMGKNAVQLLFLSEVQVKQLKQKQNYEYLSMMRYPIRKYVQYYLQVNEKKLNETTDLDLSYDTVIVGAGCSGLYSAYRILKNNNTLNQKLAIFEMSQRISGRLMSFKFKGGVTRVELGGMRYIPKSHPLLQNLINDLSIPTIDFPMTGDPLQVYARRAFLRNTPYSQEEWRIRQQGNQRLSTNYNIAENFITESAIGNKIIGMTSSQMIAFSFYRIVTEIQKNKKAVTSYLQKSGKNFNDCFKHDQINTPLQYEIFLTLEEWNVIKQILLFQMPFLDKNGKVILQPLYRMGTQNVLEMQFGHEAYQFMSDLNGYYSDTFNCSYNETICTFLIDFVNVKYKTLQGGYDMMNYNLANYLLNPKIGLASVNEACGIYVKHELVNIVQDGDKGYKLTFHYHNLRPNPENKLSSTLPFVERTVHAKKIILAMPRRSVELIVNKVSLLQESELNYNNDYYRDRDYYGNDQLMHLHQPLVPKTIYELINTTYSEPAIRIMMNFTKNWWDPNPTFNKNGAIIKSAKQMRGVSVTDLPIRQTLYFSTPTENMILGSYNDMVPTEYWNTLQLNFQKYCFKENERNGYIIHVEEQSDRNPVNVVHRASYILERQLCRQLSLVHGVNMKIILDSLKECCYQNWNVDPFGAGYHQFRSGYDIESCMKAIRKPWLKCKRYAQGKKDQAHSIFVIGEAFSNLTGWVEGAYQTAERMLQSQYKLKPPIEGYLGY